MDNLEGILVSVGSAALVVVIIAYLFYMIGLIMVLKRMRRMTWMAYVPLLNYYAQVRAVGAPGRWFWFSFPPYIGAAYAGAVALRLGRVFGRGKGFSLTWLTIGAPIGMILIARSKTEPNLEVLNTPPVIIKRPRKGSEV